MTRLHSVGPVIAAALLCLFGGAPVQGEDAAAPHEAAFTAANQAAMAAMMRGMAAAPSGDIDRDFVTLMVPHHQGAIDMAMAELRYGTDVRLKRLAQEIIVTQQEEIAAMRLAEGERSPPAAQVSNRIGAPGEKPRP